MDIKAEQRLAELEQLEVRWLKANQEFKCHRCGTVLGTVEFEEPGPDSDFRIPPTTTLCVRRGAIPLPAQGISIDMVESVLTVSASIERSYTDLRASPLIVQIEDGVRCRKCGTERKDVPLAPPFRYASELARLRRQRWHEQSACNGTNDALS